MKCKEIFYDLTERDLETVLDRTDDALIEKVDRDLGECSPSEFLDGCLRTDPMVWYALPPFIKNLVTVDQERIYERSAYAFALMPIEHLIED